MAEDKIAGPAQRLAGRSVPALLTCGSASYSVTGMNQRRRARKKQRLTGTVTSIRQGGSHA